VTRLWIEFAVDFLYDPQAMGVETAVSNKCGASQAAFTLFQTGGMLWCWGATAASSLVESWKEFVAAQVLPLDMQSNLQKLIRERNMHSYGWQYIASAVSDPDSTVPIGHVPDDAGANTSPINLGTWSALITKKWLLQKNEEVFYFLMSLAKFNASFHIMGGNVAISSDGMTAISITEREAAFQTCLPTNMMDTATEEVRQFYRRIEEQSRAWLLPHATSADGLSFQGYTEFNHISSNVVGPLKSNWSAPCPSAYSMEERKQLCMSLQESVWGTDLLTRLESIKQLFDPHHLFDCYYCVGNYDFPGPMTHYVPPKKSDEI
jgi:hypothetical protein